MQIYGNILNTTAGNSTKHFLKEIPMLVKQYNSLEVLDIAI